MHGLTFALKEAELIVVDLNLTGRTMLERLIQRGDKVSILKGRLCIIPASGKPVCEAWLKLNREAIIRQIMSLQNSEYYSYDSYSTGFFKTRFEGVALQFVSLKSGKTAYSVFNCRLKRERKTKSSPAGSCLPKGHFSVTKKHGFYNFWLSAALTMPRSLTSFHDYMGLLKGVLFSGDKSASGKISNCSLKPVDVEYADILQALLPPDNRRISDGYIPDRSRIISPDKKSRILHIKQEVTSFLGTGAAEHDNKLSREHEYKAVNTSIHEVKSSIQERLDQQSCDEWIVENIESAPFH